MTSDFPLNFMTDLAQRTSGVDSAQPHFGFRIAGVLTALKIEYSAPRRVLDIACGYGRMSMALVDAFESSEVDGVDLDATAIASATARAKDAGVSGRCRFHCLDLRQDLPNWIGKQHDVVLSLAAHGVFPDPWDFLTLAAECVAPGGRLVTDDASLALSLDEINARATMFLGHLSASGATEAECIATDTSPYLRADALSQLTDTRQAWAQASDRRDLPRRIRGERLDALRIALAATPERALITSMLFIARYPS